MSDSNKQAPQNLTEAEAAAWVKETFQAANKYLAEQGILSHRILTKESRYVAPVVAIWKFETNDGKFCWVINGDLPTDHVGEKAAATARDAMRHFALNWQLKAEAIFNDNNLANDETQQAYAELLVSRSESLYALSDKNELWQNEQAS
ncbi:DUF4826 domain-containing protein [Thalassospira xiamenensis]|nr:DUF4826 domain-containing protein [Thalassospira xiamenensis]